MKEFITNSIYSILAFFAMLLVISYFNNGYIAIEQVFTDSFNWIIIGVVIAASYLVRRRRESKKAQNS